MSCESTGIDQRGAGRRARWIMVTWFCTCLMAMMMLWHGADTASEWSTPLSEVHHVGASTDTNIGDERG